MCGLVTTDKDRGSKVQLIKKIAQTTTNNTKKVWIWNILKKKKRALEVINGRLHCSFKQCFMLFCWIWKNNYKPYWLSWQNIKFLSQKSAEKFGCTNCTQYHALRGLQMASQYRTPQFLLIAQKGQQHCEGHSREPLKISQSSSMILVTDCSQWCHWTCSQVIKSAFIHTKKKSIEMFTVPADSQWFTWETVLKCLPHSFMKLINNKKKEIEGQEIIKN